jgi:hypothetical protein
MMSATQIASLSLTASDSLSASVSGRLGAIQLESAGSAASRDAAPRRMAAHRGERA